MKKYILITAGALVVGVIGLIVLAVLNLGTLIKTVTEEYGPKITKTEVRLESADISILSGSGALDGFFLGNPDGFKMPSAMECDTIRVAIVKDSLTTDKIIIEEIYVDGPVINYEKRGGTDNFQTIVNNIKKTVAGEKQPGTEKQEDSGTQKKIQINNFIVKNATINVGGALTDAFGDQGTGISLPDIHMKDIGKEKDTSPSEAFAQILRKMTSGVSGTVSEVAKQLKEQVGKAVEGVTKGVTEGMTKGSESVGDTIKGLMNQ